MQSLEFIDNYFKGTLNPEETRQFEQKILNDPAFAEEVAFYCNTMQELESDMTAEKKHHFLKLYRLGEVRISPKPSLLRRMFTPLRVAAAALVPVIIVCWYFFQMPVSTLRLAEKYIDKDLHKMDVKMSGGKDHIQTGQNLYNEGKDAEALQEFELAIKSDPAQAEPKKFAGIVSLRMEDYDRALNYFRQVDSIPQYSNPGKFYQALTLMKRNQPGDRQEAKKLLEDVVAKKLEKHATAEEWLDSW
ncbi:MAG: hypothetical protein WCF67_17300 [Chitinophagaceae bacterium]